MAGAKAALEFSKQPFLMPVRPAHVAGQKEVQRVIREQHSKQ